jgi:hypothetical protein
MVCPANSYYSFRATALIFCRMFIHIMEVCMSTWFWFSSNILKMTGSHFVCPSRYRYMVCPAISSYSFGATALIFCIMARWLYTTLCDKVCLRQWFSRIPVSSTNKTVLHDITKIWLKVVLNTITLTLYIYYILWMSSCQLWQRNTVVLWSKVINMQNNETYAYVGLFKMII